MTEPTLAGLGGPMSTPVRPGPCTEQASSVVGQKMILYTGRRNVTSRLQAAEDRQLLSLLKHGPVEQKMALEITLPQNGAGRIRISDGKYWVIDAAGRPKIDCSFDHINVLAKRRGEWPRAAKAGGRWTYIMPDGKMMRPLGYFDSVDDFHGGLAIVSVASRWQIIDATGSVILNWSGKKLERYRREIPRGRFFNLPPQRHLGLFWAEVGGKKVVIDRFGLEHAEPDYILTPRETIDCESGFALKVENELWGIIDGSGRYLIEPLYRAITPYQHNRSWICDDTQRLWRAIDFSGATSVEDVKAQAYPVLSLGRHFEPLPLHPDPYESSVLWTRWCLLALAGRIASVPPTKYIGK